MKTYCLNILSGLRGGNYEKWVNSVFRDWSIDTPLHIVPSWYQPKWNPEIKDKAAQVYLKIKIDTQKYEKLFTDGICAVEEIVNANIYFETKPLMQLKDSAFETLYFIGTTHIISSEFNTIVRVRLRAEHGSTTTYALSGIDAGSLCIRFSPHVEDSVATDSFVYIKK